MKKQFLKFLSTFLLIAVLLFSVSCDITEDRGKDRDVAEDQTLDETISTSTFESDSESQGTESDSQKIETEDESENNTETESFASDNTESETPTEAETDDLTAVDEASRDKFYGNSNPATSYEDASDRASRGEIAGADTVPDQAPTISEYRPMIDGKYVKNTNSYYIDYNTYVVVNAYGQEVLRVYRGGGYITLEEVAAYIYAFGEPPANHSSSKRTKPTDSIWGKYLRVNNTKFSGNTTKYPYEPVLPRINGCGGDLQYWEMDIGTTGTDCDPGYSIRIYNDGSIITRGAARLVYTWNDLNKNGITDSTDVVYIFYTYNHYNDFQEYLNYFGGWGEMFGNITGGGTLSSNSHYNPTPYVEVYEASIVLKTEDSTASVTYYFSVILPGDLYYTRKFSAFENRL